MSLCIDKAYVKFWALRFLSFEIVSKSEIRNQKFEFGCTKPEGLT